MDIKVLIVEDEFITAHALRLLLEQAGYRVIGIAPSVVEAMRYLKRHSPDIVLLDIRLEGKQSGIDLARKLKEDGVAFLYISANSSQKVLEEAKKTEPYGFLVKPYREKDVLVALEIATYLHKSSIEARLRQQQMLQGQLAGIVVGTQSPNQKLLSAVQALQPYLPLDLLMASGSPKPEGLEYVVGYLRTGYDEYQAVGGKVLQFGSGTADGQQQAAAITLLNGNRETSDFHQLLAKNFGMASYISLPLGKTTGNQAYFYLCSRRAETYRQYHLELLSSLDLSLAGLLSGVTNSNAPLHANAGIDVLHAKPPLFKDVIGSHPSLLAALDQTQQVAPFATSVLILGESGTGKEMIAEALHAGSQRNGELVKVNCAALPASLIESELFGYEKGAFTGAHESKKGKFEIAHGGTLFLDEIGDLPVELQVRLLRVLQERVIDPLGSTTPRKVDVRIVAATNRNLEKAIAEGTFRLDLYYRLKVFPVTLPPLRERKSDIMPLAQHFAIRFSKAGNRTFNGISPDMEEALLAYHWPGNIRELENVIQSSVILSDGNSALQLHDRLDEGYAEPEMPPFETFEAVRNLHRDAERSCIVAALSKTNGRVRGDKGAADLLNIKPTTLESKMAKLGIRKEDFRDNP